MDRNNIIIGIPLFLVTVAFLGVKYLRAPKRRPMGLGGWAGLLVILLGESLLFLPLPWVTTFFTPIAWTGYILLADAMVSGLQGRSRLERAPRHFLSLAFWSVPLWLIFEAYNRRLENWTYVGLPDSPVARDFGYAWSFATIWPAIFETSDLVRALGFFRRESQARNPFSRTTLLTFMIAGLVMLALPLILPVPTGRYLFGLVWVGFVFLLDPLNYWWKGQSLLQGWEAGETATLRSFLVSGLACGILWEFWNYWAGAKWLYIFPIFQDWKVFEMPLPGFLGFPPFALECFVMYEFLRTVRHQLAGPREKTSDSLLGARAACPDSSGSRPLGA